MFRRRAFLHNLTLLATVMAIKPTTALFASEDTGRKACSPMEKTGRLGAVEFGRCHGTEFHVRDAGEGTRALVLTDVQSQDRGPKLENFRLKFRGPSDTPLAERIYRFSHPELGDFDVFIQPRRVVGDDCFYLASFCRLV